ncbi:MAG: hypothetical protein HUJ88_02180 [Fusobacterium necrophorum]|nr:hypothetical protein [Fusobacterium necrophorum]MCI7342681.1 hypothetical protein [Fusobacterium necrophorum]
MNDVIQFNEKHKWCGCFGYIVNEKQGRYMVAVAIPKKGTAYIFATEEEFDIVGKTNLVLVD